jgi:hypothetical protein
MLVAVAVVHPMLVAVAVVAVVQPTVVVVVAVVVQPTVVVVVQPTVVVVVVVQPTVVVPVMWTRSSRCWFGHRRLAVELTTRVTASSRQLGVQATTSRASSRCCA